MTQTKRKRQTKHRGNAAGMIEARGRTGRKPTEAEKDPKARQAAATRKQKLDRRDRAPTWRGSILRALAAAVLMLVLATVLTKRFAASLILFPIVFIMYVPLSYYTDLWFYKRRLRQKSSPTGKAAAK